MISKNHRNRQVHNWLIYDIGDKFLASHAQLFSGDLYDLGCGEMPYRDWFLQYIDTYTGVDWSGTLHDLKADIVADLNQPLPIESSVADSVVSLSVLEHLREPQIMLDEAFRIIKSGGAIVLQVPFMWHVHEAPYDFYRFTRFGLEHIFTKSGFIDIKVEPTSGFWTMWFLKFNYQLVRLAKGPRPLRLLIRTSLAPFMWLNQYLAVLLDHVWPSSEGETAGYFVTARKP